MPRFSEGFSLTAAIYSAGWTIGKAITEMTVIYEKPAFDVHVPVVVVGAGACGCVAALAAHEGGAEVIVLERDTRPQGSTSLSGGQIPGAGTKLQQKAGIDDAPDILAGDLIAKAKGQCDLEIARRVAAESARTIDWLVDLHQVPLESMTDFRYPGHSRFHMHSPAGHSGAALLAALVQAVTNAGVDIVCAAHVTALYADRDGTIRGVQIARPGGAIETMGCDALVLACNGFGGNPQLLRKYIPEIADAPYLGHVGNQGDALLWGEALGASIKDTGSFQGHGGVCAGYMTRIGWGTVADGGIMVNATGRRFSHENAGYSEQARKILSQPGGVAWAIWDERCEQSVATMLSHVESWSAGAIKRFETADALAALIGCDAAVLRHTLSEVAGMTRGEIPCPFGRHFGSNPPLAPPYLCAKLTGALFHTQGGLEVDRNARVLRADGTAFPNLFAGGGAARGLSGPSDWGYFSGSGLLMAVNLGRLAGEAAAVGVSAN